MRHPFIISLASAAFALAACGDTTSEQAIIGAGAGTAAAIVLDGNVGAGAVLGSAANVIYCRENPEKCN